tara:strand:- start:3324 stop:3755 length:432 start_codon:yes stop_codon:yes gene_type:complete
MYIIKEFFNFNFVTNSSFFFQKQTVIVFHFSHTSSTMLEVDLMKYIDSLFTTELFVESNDSRNVSSLSSFPTFSSTLGASERKRDLSFSFLFLLIMAHVILSYLLAFFIRHFVLESQSICSIVGLICVATFMYRDLLSSFIFF